jgi:hypothetical protein
MKPKFDINDDYDWVFNLIAVIGGTIIGFVVFGVLSYVFI